MREHFSRRSARLPWKCFAAAAAGGVPVGLLWWLLAPGGLNLITRDPALAAGTNPDVWLPRDLTLAGLCVFAGCLVAVFLADKGARDEQAVFLLGLAGGLGGALIAWPTGVLAGQLWGGPADTSVNASVAFTLRSLPVLILWPAATAASVFVLSLVNLLKSGPGSTGTPVAEGSAPGA
ncbi:MULTISPECIES: hypothetical protein [unclassified Arthrobacter]|uniref:hypothetical protein n=1 Tax=unclassified Pseudarthrobacter TaxID=2647000 RepID=UPI003393A047